MAEKSDQKQEYKNLIQAALFVAGKAMSVDQLSAAIGIASAGYLRGLADELTEETKSGAGPFVILRFGDKYEFTLKEPYSSKVGGLAGSPDITKGSLKILAYVSKNEPLMQSALVKAFGSSTYDHIHELLEKGFVSTKKSGRTKRIETTQRFREYFNLSK